MSNGVEIEIVYLRPEQDPPENGSWILVVRSPQHEFCETVIHASGQTYMSPPDDMVMNVYNAQETARGLGLECIYVRDGKRMGS
mgnify:CR=1 FL=1